MNQVESINMKNLMVKEYINIMKRMIKYVYPNLSEQDLDDSITYSINKRYKEEMANINNNYKNKDVPINLLDLSNYLLERKPITTAYGVLFQQHGKSPNPFAKLFKTFMDNREINKAKMFSFPPGTEDYAKYDLNQLLDKLDANALK